MRPDENSSYPLVAFVGVGNMAEAMVERAIAQGWPRDRLRLTHRRPNRRAELEKRFGCEVHADNVAAVRGADAIVLGVRPQQYADLLNTLASAFRPGQTFISIAAALSLKWLHQRLPAGVKVIRVTPPPTALFGMGVALMSAGDDAGEAERRIAERLVRTACERIQWLPDGLTDPTTGVAFGLTPFTCMLVSTLIKAGIEQGLEPEFARRLVMDGMWATARMLHGGRITPEQVIETAATPDGSDLVLAAHDGGARRATGPPCWR